MAKNQIKLCSKQDCTGCFACEGSCFKKAISKAVDSEGFYYPVINHDVCVSCRACEKVCPVINPVTKKKSGEVYAAWTRDIKVRKQSSSGGMFSVFAEKILAEGGAVVGAVMGDDDYVRHTIITSVDALHQQRGSKYVQSMLSGDLYCDMRTLLQNGRKVLFTGTPCQVAGMKNYFKMYEDILYTIDLVCHGVPSPDFFADFMKKLRKELPNLIKYNFRDFENWLVCTNVNVNVNGVIVNRYLYGDYTLYQDAFLKGYLHRENCYHCQYSSRERISDITLADFWGIGRVTPIQEDVSAGCSMVSVNSDKGRSLLESVKDQIYSEPRDIQESIDGGNDQIVAPSKRPSERDSFYKDAYTLEYPKLIKKYKLELREDPSKLVVKVKNKFRRIWSKLFL